MANVHVVSCGTSFVGRLSREGVELDWKNPADKTAIYEVLKKNPKWSAELTAMSTYLDAGLVDEAYLVGTDTPKCKFVVGALTHYLKERDIRLEQATSFVGFGEDEGDDEDKRAAFAADLQELRARTLDYVRRKQGSEHRVFIAAQGGFKPEAGVMMLVGEETGATVYYAHEHMQQSIELPTFLYKGSLEILNRVARGKGGRLTRTESQELLREHEKAVKEAVEAFALRVRRDDSGLPNSVSLTAYGKFLVEEAAG